MSEDTSTMKDKLMKRFRKSKEKISKDRSKSNERCNDTRIKVDNNRKE
jgi:hypothetical protein